jgi:beta-1,4-mannooligosaccharide/beta-1,4-mannosyl-N-acetylglucosamine phosphorylase
VKGFSALWTKLILKSYGWRPTDKVTRYPHNPILSAKDIPYEATLIFNAGVVKHNGRYLMAFRDDYSCSKKIKTRFQTHIGLAESEDGIRWKAFPEPLINYNDIQDGEVKRLYDPRLQIIDGELYMCFAQDTRHGLRGGIGKISPGLKSFEIISLSVPDNRNMVLFPEKINGMYCRLERPMPVYSRRGKELFDMWMSFSPDLIHWGDSRLILAQEDVPFANCKVGPAAPPVRTEKGWLTLFHSVKKDPRLLKNGWEPKWKKVYCACFMLLDLEDPSKVLGVYKEPLLMPEAPYELYDGFRNNVIFPCGMIEENGIAKIYYGAADTVTCLATAKTEDLISLCLEGK